MQLNRSCYTAGMASYEEFFSRPSSEDEISITYDVRPFGNRQGEAIAWFLREQVGHVERSRKFAKPLLVLVCDAKAEIPDSVDGLLSRLNALGASYELRRV